MSWKAAEALLDVLRNIVRPSRRREPESKHLGSGGFETRRTHPLTHYVIVREDLPRGVVAAQIIHAAGESSPGNLPAETRAVALSARDERHLEQIEEGLLRHQIPHVAIREPDAPWNNALMAIGLAPLSDRGVAKPVTKGLPLLK